MKKIVYGFMIVSWMSCSSSQKILYQLPTATRNSIQKTIHQLDSLFVLKHKQDVYVTLKHREGFCFLVFNKRSGIHPDLERLVRQTHHYLVLDKPIPIIMATDLWSLPKPTLSFIDLNGFWVSVNYRGVFLESGLFY